MNALKRVPYGSGRREKIGTRLSSEERRAAEAAAEAEGLRFETWLRKVALEAAEAHGGKSDHEREEAEATA